MDRAPIKLHPVADVPVSLMFPLKIPDNLSAHFYPHFVGEMKHIMPWFAAPPLIPAMSFEGSLEPVHQLLASPGAVQVEPGYALATILLVLLVDPLIQLAELLLWFGGGGPSSGNQTILGGLRRVATLNSNLMYSQKFHCKINPH